MKYDERTIIAFLTHPKVTDIAKALGVSRTTVYKYLNDPKFQTALQECKKQMLTTAVNRMQCGLDDAITVLLAIINDEDVAPQTRLNAVGTLLVQCREMMQIQEFSDRLDALERSLSDKC